MTQTEQVLMRGSFSELIDFCGLDKLSFFEGLVCSIFSNSSECFCGDIYRNMLANFWYVDSFFLKIWLSFCFTARVKLRRTSAVAVSATNLGFLPSYLTLFRHTICF